MTDGGEGPTSAPDQQLVPPGPRYIHVRRLSDTWTGCVSLALDTDTKQHVAIKYVEAALRPKRTRPNYVTSASLPFDLPLPPSPSLF
jgi:hypothetical protein